MSEALNSVIICDQSVDLHFPAHFRDVYCQLLPARGCWTQVVAFCSQPDYQGLAQHLNISLLFKPPGLGGGRRLVWGCVAAIKVATHLRWFRRRTVSVVMVHNDPLFALLGWIAAGWHGARFVYRITHLMPEEVLESRDGWSKRALASASLCLRNFLLRQSDRVVVMSDAMGAYFRGRLSLSPQKVVSLPSMIDAGQLIESSPVAEQVAKSFERRNLHRQIVYVGTLLNSRGPDILLDTLEIVREKRPEVGMIVCAGGNVQYLEEFRRRSEARGLLPFMEFRHALAESDMSAVISQADVGYCFLPDSKVTHMNSPVKLLDYIAAGTPFVSTDNPEARLISEQSGFGVIVRYAARESALGIVKMLDELDRFHAKSSEAKLWLKSHRDISRASQILVGLFADSSDEPGRIGAI